MVAECLACEDVTSIDNLCALSENTDKDYCQNQRNDGGVVLGNTIVSTVTVSGPSAKGVAEGADAEKSVNSSSPTIVGHNNLMVEEVVVEKINASEQGIAMPSQNETIASIVIGAMFLALLSLDIKK